MKTRDMISTAALLGASLASPTAIAGSAGDDTLLIVEDQPADSELIVLAPDYPGAPEDLRPLVEAELHYTVWGGEGDDMVRIPDTDLREVRSPKGRTFMIQVNPRTREVYTPSGEKLDPPEWLRQSLRQAAGGKG